MISYHEIIVVCWLIRATIGITGELHEKYVGCFLDHTNHQKLKAVLWDADNLTVDICIQKCHNEIDPTKSGMTYAALTNGGSCTCRNNSGQQMHDRHCNVKCSGDPQQFCGSDAANGLYSLYTVCPVGYFGLNCDQPCHCKRRLPCDRKTGICPDGCDEKWTGTNCNISNIEEQFIGCYGDGKANKKAMDALNPGTPSPVSGSKINSNEFCIELCSTYNYTYAGMQYGYDCYCGEKYDRYGHKTFDGTPVNCNYTCSANPSQKCGGNYSNSVYHVCPMGFYGRGCTNRCHCSDGVRCRFNGTCLTSWDSSCKPGWTGSACNNRDCGIKNGDCEPEEKCKIVDLSFEKLSVCRCDDGSYRDNDTCKPTHLHYVGCYKGNTSQDAAVELPSNDALTIEFCILKCKQLNKTYSMMEGGAACFCGDEYGQISPDIECQVPCAGNKLQYCGGTNTADKTPIYSVYTVNDLHASRCSNDADCRRNEDCSNINLNYMHISRCRCKSGFHRMYTWDDCTAEVAHLPATGIILTTLLPISLLFNALFVVYIAISANSRKPEPCGCRAQSAVKLPSSTKEPYQQEMNYDEIPADQNIVYEQIDLEKRQIVQDATSEYAALKHDDYLNAESSI